MKITPGSPLSLTPAAPGWWVKLPGIRDHSRIVAWAVIVLSHLEDGTTFTGIEPVFFYEGTAYTESQWLKDFKPEDGIEVIEP
ncbi:hypothetical protein [Streptomyces sp.]|uniref:hypothetical protein n=1 Tax=Streptomyces sp. TaxID=1931 RepID=UPI002F91C94F